MRGSITIVAPAVAGLALLGSALLTAENFHSLVALRSAKTEPNGNPPTLGNYPDTSTALSANTVVIPDAAPTNTTSINVSTLTGFQGTLQGDPATGLVRVTDAHPGGTYSVRVKAFNSGASTTTTTFTLTVTTAPACIPISFASAANFVAGTTPYSVAVGDFNGDGKQDLAVANFGSDDVSILLGDGAGNFSATTNFVAGTSPISVAVGDFNGDGKQDLAVANQGSADVSILLGDGAGNFSAPTNFVVGGPLLSMAVGDFNRDGKQDLAVTNSNSLHNVLILLGDGAGHFSAPTNFTAGLVPVSIAVGYFNGDDIPDLAVADPGSNSVSILLGDGSGHFPIATPFDTQSSGPYSVAVSDFNGDGKQDLAVANFGSHNVSILLGDGTGNFSAANNFIVGSNSNPYSVAVGDFDGDDKQDLAVANNHSNNVSILLGDGVGSFGAAINFSAGTKPYSVAVGDFNGDGKQDLAVANHDSDNVSVFLRDCAASQTPTVTPSATSTPTASPTPSATPTVTPSTTATPTASPAGGKVLNISTRMRVETGNNVLIGGFIITGSTPKQVVVRGIGPSLGAFGVPDALADPTLELRGSNGALILANDNWESDPSQAAQLTALGLGLQDPNESGLVTTLQPGSYTTVLAGNKQTTGVGLVEVYDTNQTANSQLANISTRGFVLTGSNVMIGGFILGGINDTHIVVRGIGPSLTQFGVPNALADPTLELRDSNGALLVSNDNWQDDAASAAQLTALGLAPESSLESGIYRLLPPGAFTATLAGNNEGTGVGLVEAYNVH